MAEHLTDEELEQAFRDGLRRRAEGAPPALREGVPRPDGERPGPRRRSVWLAAAAAAVVAVGVPVALHRVGGAVSTQPPASTTVSTGSVAPAPGWRLESYGGVELSVPDDWGWGGTPVNPGIGGGDVCEVRGATIARDGTRDANATMELPFVGRPVLQSDACASIAPQNARPDVDAVWFASPRPVGTTGDARTVAVAGQRLSVFTANAELRDRILASVRVVGEVDGNGCPRTPDGDPGRVAGMSTDLVVCAYVEQSGRTALLFSARRGQATAEAYEKALGAAPRTAITPCPVQPRTEKVLVGRVAGGRVVWDAVQFECLRLIPAGEGRAAGLTPALTRPWSGPEARAYLVGPHPAAVELTQDFHDLFRGILG
jgi:hypothetical protein